MKVLLSIILLFPILVGINAQSKFQISPQSTTVVKGTSTLHDWESQVETISGMATIQLHEGSIASIEDLKAKFKAKSIKSGKSRMDKITYDAIKADEHTYITFELDRFEPGNGTQVTAHGRLHIAGSSQKVSVVATAEVQGEQLVVTGSHPIKLTDYGIDPPTAMLGAIKVGNDLIIEFTLVFSK